MGEIKSTLDLVLEKTKNLTLSSEEKESQKQKEIENRIKGMVQKYQDGILSINQLIADYELLKKEYTIPQNNSLIVEITQRIEPDQDNQSLLELLQECCTIDTTAIESIIENFRKQYIAASQSRIEQLKEDLAQRHNISGSAVLPNLDVDEQWRQKAGKLRAGYEEQLSRVKDNLIGGRS
ncbi:MAG: hypothetical protein PVH37_24170 [Desulfobacterales bacterium]|jgi:hypothetical protein